MKEKAVLFGANRTLVGIVSSRDVFSTTGRDTTGILLLNSGLIHRVGPSRIYVKLARKIARLGYAVMRFDMSGIGDSRASDDRRPQEEIVKADIADAMDYLQRSNGIERFVAIGICSGAAAAFLVAGNDPRIRGAVLINPLVPKSAQTELMSVFQYYTKEALFRKTSWIKLLTIQSNFRTIWNTLVLRIKRKVNPGYIRDAEAASLTEGLKRSFRGLRQRGVRLLFISSATEIGYDYVSDVLGENLKAMEAEGLIRSIVLADADHSVTPLGSQQALIETICAWLDERGWLDAEEPDLAACNFPN